MLPRRSALRRLLATGIVVAATGAVVAAAAPGVAVAASTTASSSAVTSPKVKPGFAVKGWKAACGKPGKGEAACLVLVDQGVAEPQSIGVNPAANPPGYGPADFAAAYNLPSTGTTTTVAIVDAYNDPNAASDLAVYRAQYGLPACTTGNGCFRQIDEDGSTTLPGTDPTGGWEVEESLDLDMVSAICPTCHILLVEGNSNSYVDLGTSVDRATSLGARFVSNSYGGSEFSGETSYDTSYYKHPGDVITASNGDDGYGAAYPAASPWVVAVGGTSLTETGTGTRGWSETVWGSSGGGEGTGSGCSADDTKPSWQTDSGCSDRTIGDVSADADPDTGAAIYDTYPNEDGIDGWGIVGGTSEASPIIASVYAEAGTPASGSWPAKYLYTQHKSTEINDITSGANGSCSPAYLCTAEVGYDAPTGWGTPWGVTAFQAPGSVASGPITSGISGQCVGDKGSGTANYTVIDIYTCNGTAPQVWGVESGGTLRDIYNGKCMSVLHSGTTSGSLIDQYTCNDSSPQVWKAESGELVNTHSGLCLTDPSSGGNGTQLEIVTCTGATDQLWTLP